MPTRRRFISGLVTSAAGLCQRSAGTGPDLHLVQLPGLDFVHRNSPTSRKYLIETMCGGVALFDYDNDGLLDVFFVNSGRLDDPVKNPINFSRSDPRYWNRLYRQNKDGTFSDVTRHAGLHRESDVSYGMGVATGDYDNDGFTDLYVTNYGRNVLYHNNGDGTFTDVTVKAGVAAGGCRSRSDPHREGTLMRPMALILGPCADLCMVPGSVSACGHAPPTRMKMSAATWGQAFSLPPGFCPATACGAAIFERAILFAVRFSRTFRFARHSDPAKRSRLKAGGSQDWLPHDLCRLTGNALMRLLLAFLLAAILATAQTPRDSASSHLKRASDAKARHDYSVAATELRLALDLQPGDRAAHGMLGQILLDQGFAAQALHHLEVSGQVYPHGLALIELNRLPDGLRTLLAVYAARPDDPDVLFHVGEACGTLMQQAFNRLMRLHPDSSQARELQSPPRPAPPRETLESVKTLDRTLSAYTENRDQPEVLFELGDQARTVMQLAFNRLLKSHPGSARAQELQARMLLGEGRGAAAEPLFRKSLAADPYLPGVHLALGRIMQDERGDLAGAEKEYRSEVRLRTGDAQAAWRLGSLLLKTGQGKEALQQLQLSDRLKPDMIETLLDLGAAYSLDDQVAQAEKAYGRIIEIDDHDELAAAAHLRLSQIYRKQGRISDAERHLKRFRELNSTKDSPDGQKGNPGL